MIANENTVKKMRDRHVGEEEVSHYQTQKIHLFFFLQSCSSIQERNEWVEAKNNFFKMFSGGGVTK